MKSLSVFLCCFFAGIMHSQTFVIHPADSAQSTVIIDKNGNPLDTSIKENTAAEKAAIKSAFDSLNCNCSKSSGNTSKIHEDGILILFKNGKVRMKGCFRQKKLICGIECVYDASGNLIRIKKIQNGIVTGEIPFPN